jgi:hypothetical protein
MYFATSLALFGCLATFLSVQLIQKALGRKAGHVLLPSEEEQTYEQVELNANEGAEEEEEITTETTFVIE